MGLFEDAIEDAKSIVTDASTGFAVTITLTALNNQIAVVNGLHTKHHLNIDPDTGAQVSGKNASICVSEGEILTVNPAFNTRNARNEANMKNVKVLVKDSTGSVCNYIINTCFADETLGLFTCILGDTE